MSKHYVLKDLANEMGLHPRQVRRWCAKLKVPPSVPSQPSNKWDEAARRRLLTRWRTYWERQRASVARLMRRRAAGARLSRKQLSQIATFHQAPRG